jgi:hypothetical protein
MTDLLKHFEDLDTADESEAALAERDLEDELDPAKAAVKKLMKEKGLGGAFRDVLMGKHKKATVKPRPEIIPTRLDEVPDELVRDLLYANAKVTMSISCARCGRTVKADGMDADRVQHRMEELYNRLTKEDAGWGNHPYREDGKIYCPHCINALEKSFGLTDGTALKPVYYLKVLETCERTVALEADNAQDALERFIIGEQYDYAMGEPEVVQTNLSEGFCGVTGISDQSGNNIPFYGFFDMFDATMLKTCQQVCEVWDETEEKEGEA